MSEKPLVRLYGRTTPKDIQTSIRLDDQIEGLQVDEMTQMIEGWVEGLMELYTDLKAGNLSEVHPLH